MRERLAEALNESGAMSVRFVIILVLVFCSLIFIFQNLTVVEIQFLFWKTAMSRFFLLTGGMLVGVVIGILLGWEVFGKRKAYRSGPKNLSGD